MAVQTAETQPESSSENRMPQVASGAGGFRFDEWWSGGGMRQVALIGVLAAAVAVAVVAFLWAQSPSYQMLYGDLDDRDAGRVAQSLEEADIAYRTDDRTGAIEVPRDEIHDARMHLASEGLPRGVGQGFEMIEDETGFGVSQFMEQARYQHALESELSRTIGNLDAIERARVHLAVPEDSVFVRDRREPSASVNVDLYQGRNLSDSQANAIVHMVASAVPDMNHERVTLVDQRGRMLTDQGNDSDLGSTDREFEHKQQVERAFRERVEDILRPIVGSESVRAQVNASLDFTRVEETEELWDPETTALRSEEESEDPTGVDVRRGIPGALTNQPPGLVDEGDLDEEIDEDVIEEEAEEADMPAAVARRFVRNYEVDRTMAHTVQPLGQLERLSVAVLVDERPVEDEEGEMTTEALGEDELAQIEELVQEAVGFDADRGDSIQVVNQAFADDVVAEEPDEPMLWEQPWMQELIRNLIGLLLVLVVVFGVLRPGMRRLMSGSSRSREMAVTGGAGAVAPGPDDEAASTDERDSVAGEADRERMKLDKPDDYDEKVEAAQSMVGDDPKRVAQVVRNWVSGDG